MNKVDILIVDDDEASQSAYRQLLGSEDWHIRVASHGNQVLQELATGNCTLVIASVMTIGLSGALYTILKELAFAPAAESGKTRVRVLFVISERDAPQAQSVLEREGLPYTFKPFHFHDFLDKVSDLLMESGALSTPIRRVRQEENPGAGLYAGRYFGNEGLRSTSARNTGMFANREDYSMTEEDVAEYERQQVEEVQRRKKKKQQQHLG